MRASSRLRFPAPRFARAAREPGHARVWPSLLLAAFALAAFAFGGLVGFLLGFTAVLLIIDRTWPITGLLMTDAQHASARLGRQRRLAALARRLKRRPADEGQLLQLPDQLEAGAQRRTLGIPGHRARLDRREPPSATRRGRLTAASGRRRGVKGGGSCSGSRDPEARRCRPFPSTESTTSTTSATATTGVRCPCPRRVDH